MCTKATVNSSVLPEHHAVPALSTARQQSLYVTLYDLAIVIATSNYYHLLVIFPFNNSQISLGNAVLFQDEPRVTTFSMHCEQNIFSKKQNSDVDIELQAGTGDVEYLAKLQSW
jgi:hypothetical protein